MGPGTWAGMDESEQAPETVIRAYPDGPLLVRGDFQLLDEDGEPINLHRGTIALCRCGRSASKPFCDGLHSLARRRDGSAAGRAERRMDQRESGTLRTWDCDARAITASRPRR
jgi:CDGSH-type Zn-finger protein